MILFQFIISNQDYQVPRAHYIVIIQQDLYFSPQQGKCKSEIIILFLLHIFVGKQNKLQLLLQITLTCLYTNKLKVLILR